MRDLAFVDFETESIDPRGVPQPVGVAIDEPGRLGSKYLAWGHPTGNNCSMIFAKSKLRDIYEKFDVAYHHAQFDVDVGEIHLKLRPKRAIHCTLIQAFLHNPHSPTLELKELADLLCGVAPAERDELREWILLNVPGATAATWGAHICEAPGDLVAPYA